MPISLPPFGKYPAKHFNRCPLRETTQDGAPLPAVHCPFCRALVETRQLRVTFALWAVVLLVMMLVLWSVLR